MDKTLISFDGKYMIYSQYGVKEEWNDARIYLFSNGQIIIKGLMKEYKLRCKDIEPVDKKIPPSATGLVTMFETYKIKQKDIFLLIHGDKKDIKKLTRFICYFKISNELCYILYPYMIGGAIQKNVKWKKSILEVKLKRLPGKFEEKLIFRCGNDIITIPLEKVIDFKKDKITVAKKEVDVLNLKFLDEKNVSYVMLIYILNLNILYKILESYFDEHDIKREEEVVEEYSYEDVELNDKEEQVLYALYSGINPLEVHSLLGLDVGEVEKIYDKLIELKLLKLVRLRKEVELTSKGKYFVEKIMKEKGTKI